MGGKNFITETQEASNNRYELDWIFGEQGKPGLNADVQNANEAVRMVADRHFEVQGLNAISAGSLFFAEGGITLTTTAGANDAHIVEPHEDGDQTAWEQTTWGIDRETHWECWIATGGVLAAATIWAGLKLTNTPVSATDNDQVFFRLQDTVAAGNWQAVHDVAGAALVETDTGVVSAINTVYHFKIVILPNRIAQMYINDVLVDTTAALSIAVDLIPFVGILTGGGALSMRLFRQKISRLTLAA